MLDVHFPIFRDAERVIADPPVRNRGTIGGALCQADPAEDLSAVCAACHAQAVDPRPRAASASCAWTTSTSGPYETAVGDGEMLVEIRLPMRSGPGSAYEKVERRAGDWAVAAIGAALWIEPTAGRSIVDAGIGLSALGDVLRAKRAEEALEGAEPTDETVRRGGADRRRGLLAGHRRARVRGVQATPGRRADAARAAPRAPTACR